MPRLSPTPTAAGAVTIAGALWLSLSGAAPASHALALTLAAVVALGGWASPALGLVAVVTAAATHGDALPTPIEWTALAATGLALGLISRHVERDLPRLLGRGAFGSAVWLALGVAAVAWLPADFVQLLDASGAPLLLEVGLADPTTAARALVEVPVVVPHVRPLGTLLAWLPWIGVAAAFMMGVAAARDAGWRAAWAVALATGAAAIAVGLAGVAELIGGGAGAAAMPTDAEWIVELGWLGGGAIGTSPGPLPEEASLGLASRPVVDTLLALVGLALAGLAGRHLRRDEAPATLPATEPRPWLVPLVVAAVAGGVVAAAAGLPSGLGWTAASGTLFVLAALLGALFRTGHGRIVSDLQVFAAVTWVFGLVAPLAGWMAP